MRKYFDNTHMPAALLLMAAAALAACSGDDNTAPQYQPATPEAATTYTLSVEASKGHDATDGTTRALTEIGSTLNATWNTEEHIYVKKGATWASGSLQPQTDGATATLKGTVGDITIENTDVLTLQFPKSGELTYAGQLGTLLDIATNFDYATATVTATADGEKVTTTKADFENQQAIVKFTLTDKADESVKLSPTALTISDGTNTIELADIPTSTYDANGSGVLYVAIPGFADKTVTLTATVGTETYTYEKTGVTFTNGQYYAINVKMTRQVVVGSLATVSAEDVGKVVGSDGLLYKKASDVPSPAVATGLIFYVGAEGTADASTGSESYKGLAIALRDAGNASWGANASYSYFPEGNEKISDAITDMPGIQNTATLRSDASTYTNSDSYAASVAVNFKNTAPTPEGTSGWFLPSFGQWYKFLNGYCGLTWDFSVDDYRDSKGGVDDLAVVNAKFTAIGADDAQFVQSRLYWSSTERPKSWAYYVQFGPEGNSKRVRLNWKTKYSSSLYVRPFFAF